MPSHYFYAVNLSVGKFYGLYSGFTNPPITTRTPLQACLMQPASDLYLT